MINQLTDIGRKVCLKNAQAQKSTYTYARTELHARTHARTHADQYSVVIQFCQRTAFTTLNLECIPIPSSIPTSRRQTPEPTCVPRTMERKKVLTQPRLFSKVKLTECLVSYNFSMPNFRTGLCNITSSLRQAFI